MSIMDTERKLRAMTASLPKIAAKAKDETPGDSETPDTNDPCGTDPCGADPSGAPGAVTVLYNGGCPLCRAEMTRYQRLGGAAPADLAFHDVARDPSPLAPLGVTVDGAKRRLHVLDTDGQVIRGIDGFILLWRQMPRYRWLARVVGLPGVKWVAIAFYDGLLVPLLWQWNRRRERRAAHAASRTADSR